MNIQTRNNILTLVLGVVILLLGYWLYRSIVDPYQVVIAEEQMTERVQERMSLVRDALIRYRNVEGGFPPEEGGLDSLIAFIDSTLQQDPDNLTSLSDSFQNVNLDSLKYSPRPPYNEFEYAVNDTLRPPIYLLEDPDSDLRIGDLETTSLLNAPNWN